MLSCKQKLAKRLRCVREKSRLSQGKAAGKIGVTQSYLAQVEMGYRPISGRCLEKLELLYGVKFGKLWKGAGRRGRPGHVAATRAGLKQMGRALSCFWKSAEVSRLEHPQPHQVRGLKDPLWPMALHLGLEAREEVKRLELLRADDEFFWRNFNSLRFDSWSEKRLQVRLALLGAQLLGVRLRRLGCELRCVDGVTGKEAGLHRGYVLKGQTASLVWCPQVAVATRRGYRCVDNLLVLSSGVKRVTLAVEVDGENFHRDKAREARRDRELGVPVLHVGADRLGQPGLIREILQWAQRQLETA